MVFARLSRFYSFQLQHILLLSVISLLQLLLGSCASTKGYFESKKTSSWGVHVKRHKKDFSIIMKSDVVGQLPQKAYELGDYLPIAESGMFELGVVPVIYDGINQFNELSPCIEEFSKI